MASLKFISLTRAWLRKTLRNAGDVDVSLSGPSIKLNFKADEPIETRAGIDIKDKRPFYESDPETLFGYYYAYVNTPEYLDNIVYADIVPLRSGKLNGITLNAVAVEALTVSIEPSSYRVPEKLCKHAEAAVKLFKDLQRLRYFEADNSWENNVSLRIDDFNQQGVLIACRKARYFDQIASNLTMDWASGKLSGGWHTIRSGMERPEGGKLRPLKDSNLANTLGVAAMLYQRDLSPIFRVRSESLASISKSGLHCTASGVHEIEESHPPGYFDFSIFSRGKHKEIKHEIGLDEHEYHLFPVAFARELPRGGKPQLFFVAVARVDNARIEQAMAGADEAYEYLNDLSAKLLLGDGDARSASRYFTYEGWACLKFAERFIEANQGHLTGIGASESSL
jgi:hypothetical protein